MNNYGQRKKIYLVRSWKDSYLAAMIDLAVMVVVALVIFFFQAYDSFFWYVMCAAVVWVICKIIYELTCVHEIWIAEGSNSIIAIGIRSEREFGIIDDLMSITADTTVFKGRTIRIATSTDAIVLHTWVTPSITLWVKYINEMVEIRGGYLRIDLAGGVMENSTRLPKNTRDDWHVECNGHIN